MINILISDDNNDLVELIFKEIFRKNKNFREFPDEFYE